MYKISIFSSPITLPLSFATHTWIVVESPIFGEKRYEIHGIKNKKTNTFLFENNQLPQKGMPVLIIPSFFKSKICFSSKLIFSLEGDEARGIVETIEKNIPLYKHLRFYRLYPGPNSNTFVRWILDLHEKTTTVELPWNAFGEFYARRFKK